MATNEHRVLDPAPVDALSAYQALDGGRGLEAARAIEPAAVVGLIEAAGLRGRGGAGFPTGTKWRAVLENRSPTYPTTVVVNAAEGEPGSFKDRAILRANPYRVIEGALIAAHAVGAARVVVAIKADFKQERDRVNQAINDIHAAGWAEGVDVVVIEGPTEYLYGEETALLEVIEGRPPFPRVQPPYRHGVVEIGRGATESVERDEVDAPPALVNNVETMANVPLILSKGVEWFRSVGTAESPGTIVCTVTGRTQRHGVGEFALGTPLAEVIAAIGGGPVDAHRYVAALSGVANAFLPADRFDTPVSYEGMTAAGSGLGAAGFIVFDDTEDLVAVAQGVSQFLAIESCGQCTPCKRDGLAIAERLDNLRQSAADEHDLEELAGLADSITVEARCYLATQHQAVVTSLLHLFPEQVRAHLKEHSEPAELIAFAPIVDIDNGVAVIDERQLEKKPDWTFDEVDSGKWPAERFANPAAVELEQLEKGTDGVGLLR